MSTLSPGSAAAEGLGRVLASALSLRRLRLASGLVLFVYVALHLTDHALGNVSLQTMETMLTGMKRVWQSPPGAAILYGGLGIHVLLALWALYERRYFRWTRSEIIQLGLGFTIPVLLANHILATRISLSLYGTDKGYAIELWSFWVGNIAFGVVQHVVLVVAWAHGCMGVFFWLRLKRCYASVAPVLLALAVLLPVLALLGSFQQGRQVQEWVKDPAWRAANLPVQNVGSPAQAAVLVWWRERSWAVFAAMLALVVLARGLRSFRERQRGLVRLRLPSSRIVVGPQGMSVLEIIQLNNIPHSSACGGRGRCTTCRIRVAARPSDLPALCANESAALVRIGAGPDVRLACQLRPMHSLTLTPLVVDGARTRKATVLRTGEERRLVMMFVDLRGSTKLAERHLPFDTVFLLNSFLAAVGESVEAHGGRVNQILGDGMLVLFGLACSFDAAAKQAVAASVAMARRLRALEAELASSGLKELGYGIGVHGGEVVLGHLGFSGHMTFTVLGDAVNVAARLQDATKTLGCCLLASEEVAAAAGGLEEWPSHVLNLRGRSAALPVRAAELGTLLALSDRQEPSRSNGRDAEAVA